MFNVLHPRSPEYFEVTFSNQLESAGSAQFLTPRKLVFIKSFNLKDLFTPVLRLSVLQAPFTENKSSGNTNILSVKQGIKYARTHSAFSLSLFWMQQGSVG